MYDGMDKPLFGEARARVGVTMQSNRIKFLLRVFILSGDHGFLVINISYNIS